MAKYDAGVLVVDDELFYREAIRDALAPDQLSLSVADNGEQALELAADLRVGVVVLDIRLPDMDGIQVLERLRELRPGLRVIVLSASTDQDLVLDALRLGASDYLAKPLHAEELRLAVRRALDSYSVANDWNRLRGRLDRLVARIEELKGRACAASPDERLSLLQEGATSAASDVLEAERTSLMMIEPDGETLRVVASVGHEVKLEELDPISLKEGIAGLAILRGEPMVFEDVSSDIECGNLARPDRYGSASFAVAPLLSGSGIFGVICATDRAGGGRFGSDDLALLRLLAMQLADLVAAADGTSLADEPATSRDDSLTQVVAPAEMAMGDSADAAESERDADLAREICLAISDEVEPERVIEAALKPMSTLLPAAPVALYLVDATSGELRREGECDGGLSGDREVLARDRGLTGTVLQTGCVVATHEPDADPRFDAEMDTPENGQVRPFFCLPLRLRGKVVGLCRAFLEEGAVASPRTGEVLSAALSAAVRNALLYRSLLESIEDVAEARRTARQ